MRKRILSIATAGLLLAGITTPAGAVYLGNGRQQVYNTSSAVYDGVSYEPDEEGVISYEKIETRMRASNPSILSFQATLDSQLAFNREKAYDNLLNTIKGLGDYAFYVDASVSSTIDSLRDQLDLLKEDNYMESIEMLTKQIENVIQQMVVGAEGLYINILTLEATLHDLDRTIDMLDRNMSELELRYELGQISKLTLDQFKATYDATKIQVSTLENNIELMKAALQNMVGEPPTGQVTLASIPELNQAQQTILNMGYDDALEKAKNASFTIYQADKDLKDAEDDWKDAKKDYRQGHSNYAVAEQTYLSAVYSHDSTIKTFELSFKNAYQAIPNAQLTLAAAQTDLAFQKQNFETVKVRYDLGQISYNTLISAEEEVLAAQSALESAEVALFAAYMDYFWAVEYGLL